MIVGISILVFCLICWLIMFGFLTAIHILYPEKVHEGDGCAFWTIGIDYSRKCSQCGKVYNEIYHTNEHLRLMIFAPIIVPVFSIFKIFQLIIVFMSQNGPQKLGQYIRRSFTFCVTETKK